MRNLFPGDKFLLWVAPGFQRFLFPKMGLQGKFQFLWPIVWYLFSLIAKEMTTVPLRCLCFYREDYLNRHILFALSFPEVWQASLRFISLLPGKMGMSGILHSGFWLCSWGPVPSSALLHCSGLWASFSCLYFKQMEGRARARSKSCSWGIMGIKGRYQGDFKRQDAREGWHSEIRCQSKERGTKQTTQKSNGPRPL